MTRLTTHQQILNLFAIAKRSKFHALQYRDSAGIIHYFIELPTHQAHYAVAHDGSIKPDSPRYH